ncbi:polysaccharide pyruvyl transferase family protein [Serratia marcescens]|uniref:polysaccharide pyruvyl transferase family protein n=1 Tax=Serratia marcescens TaxID=615 RepID=UPI001F0CD5F5|nr:polysaccharide pyruvyl transferase family protein [Serratia marcescens]
MTSEKRQVIFYGAFDRYNYGDNLMPILLEMYFQKKHGDKVKDLDFVFSSIRNSDLRNYDCKQTTAMRNLLNVPKNSTVLLVGGEILGADVGILYIHVQENPVVVRFLRMLRRVSPSALTFLAKLKYDAVWQFPYIPQKESFANDINIVYNTVGAVPNKTQLEKIKQADYISVRDERTYKGLSEIGKVKLVPDSVLMMSKVVDMEFLELKVRSEIKDLLKERNFITVQACPYKVRFSAKQMADELHLVKNEHGVDTILLPIGYASGHDDAIFLDKVNALSGNNLVLLNELNVWEIMYVIAKSIAFYGTSLHGVITAMSFKTPHFCINGDITKLVSFLETWSVYPYNKPLSIEQISPTVKNAIGGPAEGLEEAVEHAQKLIFSSLDEIVDIL